MKPPDNVISTAVLAFAVALVAGLAMAVNWPTPGAPAAIGANTTIDGQALRREVVAVRDTITARLAACTPRVLGQPGIDQAADVIVEFGRELGAEVFELPVSTPVQVVRRATLEPLDGPAPVGLSILPFAANHLQPSVTPPEGLVGVLTEVDDAWVASGQTGQGAIALVDAAAPAQALGLNWSRYAGQGFAAIIVTHSSGLQAMDWTAACLAMEGVSPVVYPRAVASPEVLSLAGRRVRLHAQGAWEDAAHRAILLRLRAARPAAQAVAITVPYDVVAAIPGLPVNPSQDAPLVSGLAAFAAIARQHERLGRDVLLIAAAGSANRNHGLSMLLAAAGPQLGNAAERSTRQQREADLDGRLAGLERLAGLVGTSGFLTDATATAAACADLIAEDRQELHAAIRGVIGDLALELQEHALAARLAALRAEPRPNVPVPTALLDGIVAANQAVTRVKAMASWPAQTLAERGATAVGKYGLDDRLRQRVAGLITDARGAAVQAQASRRIGDVFAGYGAVYAVELRPAPGGGARRVAVLRGGGVPLSATGLAFAELCGELVAEAGAEGPILRPVSGSIAYADQVEGGLAGLPLHATHWTAMGYPAVALVHDQASREYRTSTSPQTSLPPDMRLERLAIDLVAALAAGRGDIPLPKRVQMRATGGRVLAAEAGSGLIPDHPLSRALVMANVNKPENRPPAGYARSMVMRADLDGTWGVPSGPFQIEAGYGKFTPIVAAFGADGRISWIKDQGAAAQRMFSSEAIGHDRPKRINMIAFRAEPIVLTDRLDPRRQRPWAEIRPLLRGSLATPPSLASWDGPSDLTVHFLRPERHVFLSLNAGSPDNPLNRVRRSVLLGPPAGDAATQDAGIGLLPADRPWINETAKDSARSLLRLDAASLRQQRELGLADEAMAATETEAHRALTAAESAGDRRTVLRESRRAGALAQQNHEAIQGSLRQAVANIVWYLVLLVPFALFAEKLLIGSADVRRQILWSALIFLGAFTVIGLLHPAFPLLSSPAMILLGFIIMLIALGVSGLFLGRFQENLRNLQAKRGQVDGARVDILGVTATAVLLGLNGLSRRKMRTGLTSATLVLITFALICFAGLRSQARFTTTAIGPASYSGLLVADPEQGGISEAESVAARERYGPDHHVCERWVIQGSENWRTKQRGNPEIGLVRDTATGRSEVRALGALAWQHDEPLAARLRLVAGRPWAEAEITTGTVPVMLPDALANHLSIEAQELAAGPVRITLNGQAVEVVGIFAAESLAGLRDLDGGKPLPFDIEASVNLRKNTDGRIIFGADDPHIDPGRLVVLPTAGITAMIPSSERRLTNAAVVFSPLPYREAKALITEHQLLSGRPLAYGIDGAAFIGRPATSGGFGGIDLLIPLLIAALTVLNTMRGSVYERRDEIAVFNAVGIAPRFIAAMFFAEAMVYAVVGAVAGFLLALLLGRGLPMLGLDAGLKLDVASLAPVYASLALAAAVFLSTWFPARQAAEIAAPSDDSGWKMPVPDGDRMSIELPFVFDNRDRLGVLAFFARWFRDHGEGGAGPFQAAEPVLSADRVAGAAVPRIATRIWLKPFDQGVAQELRIELRPDANGEHLALLTIERTSGSRDAWLRLNRPFMGVLRRHFLYWRAVDPAMRAELFTEAGTLLRAAAEETNHV